MKKWCWPGSLPAKAAEACRNGDVSNSPTSKMPAREKAAGMKAARIVRRKPASARSIWISTSTFASGVSSPCYPPQYAGGLARFAAPPPCGREVICPSGIFVSSPLCKNISLHPSGKSSLQIRAIPPHKGRIAIVTDAGCGCGGRGSVLRAMGWQGG